MCFLFFTYLILFLSYKQRRGGLLAAARLPLFVLLSLFSRPQACMAINVVNIQHNGGFLPVDSFSKVATIGGRK